MHLGAYNREVNTNAGSRLLAAVVLLSVSVACGTSDDGGNADRTADRDEASSSSSASSLSPSTVELTSDRLAAYERGMKKEIEAVRAAQQRAGAAQNAQERGEAIQAAFEGATVPLGAAAAGLSVEEYRQLRDTVNGVFRTLDFQGKIDGPLSMDLSRADEATKTRLARDAFADLSPDSAASLRGRMDQLVPVWIDYVTLTAVAG